MNDTKSPAYCPMGITKREYYAASAMQSLMRTCMTDRVGYYAKIAEFAFAMADAMIAESNKEEKK